MSVHLSSQETNLFPALAYSSLLRGVCEQLHKVHLGVNWVEVERSDDAQTIDDMLKRISCSVEVRRIYVIQNTAGVMRRVTLR